MIGLFSRIGYPGIVVAVAGSAVGLAAIILSSSSTAAPGVTCDGHAATIVGTSGGDDLNGTSGPDVINGLGGDDTIAGKGGRDRLCGGRGNDVIRGGAKGASRHSGNDRLFGGSGKDDLIGQDRNDDLFGFNGKDVLEGDDGADLLKGGRKDDRLFAGDGNDNLDGGENIDVCDGGAGQNTEVHCEPANLSLRVVGPLTAADGATINYKVIVKNHGPADVLDYKLDLQQDNHDLQCDNENFDDGVKVVDFPLDAGDSRNDVLRVTCHREAPVPGTVTLKARVFGGTPRDRVASNNKDKVTTTVE